MFHGIELPNPTLRFHTWSFCLAGCATSNSLETSDDVSLATELQQAQALILQLQQQIQATAAAEHSHHKGATPIPGSGDCAGGKQIRNNNGTEEHLSDAASINSKRGTSLDLGEPGSSAAATDPFHLTSGETSTQGVPANFLEGNASTTSTKTDLSRASSESQNGSQQQHHHHHSHALDPAPRLGSLRISASQEKVNGRASDNNTSGVLSSQQHRRLSSLQAILVSVADLLPKIVPSLTIKSRCGVCLNSSWSKKNMRDCLLCMSIWKGMLQILVAQTAHFASAGSHRL